MAQAPAIPLNFQRFAIVIGKFCGPTERRALAQPDSWVHAHLDESLWHRPEVVVGAGERPWAVWGGRRRYPLHATRLPTDLHHGHRQCWVPNPSCGEDRWPQQHRSNARLHRGLPEDVFDAYERFINNRRLARPSAEYHERTQTEWDEFIQHFGQRKIALGSCHRPYGSDCAHEHACIRCDFCQIDPSQSGRLDEIRDNLRLQAEEAQRNRWLGDVGTATAHHPACGSEG